MIKMDQLHVLQMQIQTIKLINLYMYSVKNILYFYKHLKKKSCFKYNLLMEINLLFINRTNSWVMSKLD